MIPVVISPARVLVNVLLAAAVGFGAGWLVNGWRLGEQIAQIQRDQAIADEAAIEIARLKERAWNKQVEDARNEATKRETNLRRDAAGARRSADSLRDDLDALRRQLPGLAADACRERADTVAELFGECSARYTELAEKADSHTSDVRTLTSGWPSGRGSDASEY